MQDLHFMEVIQLDNGLWNSHYKVGTFLGTGDTEVEEQSLWSLYSHEERQAMKKINALYVLRG